MRSLILSSRGSTITEDRKSVVSGHSSNVSVPTLTQETTGKPNTPLRKFTHGVSRPGEARQAREAVRNVMSSQNPSRVPPIAQPLDYEKFITDRNIRLDNDPQFDLLLFPRDDIEEICIQPEQSTVVPNIYPEDEGKAHWLLTKEAIHFYTQPYRTICFNYSRFSGDYDKVNQGSTLEGGTPLASLVFESDLALEEAAANEEGFLLPDIVKQGVVTINRSDTSLIQNMKSGKKRHCTLRRNENGDVIIEIRKAPTADAKIIKINSAQLRQTKKGKPILEIEPITENQEKSETPLTIYSEDSDEIQSWLQSINRCIAFSTKIETISLCADKLEKDSFGKNEQQQDTVSTTSDDSSGSKDILLWKGRDIAARALKPPIVERHNLFSLYYRLSPLRSTPSAEKKARWNCSPEISNNSKFFNTTISSGSSEKVQSFSIKVSDLSIKLPSTLGIPEQIEPFFISIFLFNSKDCRRLTEEFHIDASGAKVREITPGASDPKMICLALSTYPTIKEALFTLAASVKDLWLVCRIDRALHPDTAGDIYMKANPDPKIVQKIQRSIQASLLSGRLSTYKQRFAWTAKPIQIEGCPCIETIGLPLYRCENNKLTDQDLSKYLIDFTRFEKNKNTIPKASITISIDSTAASADYPCRISPSLLPLKPWIFDSKEPKTPIFEVQSFGDIQLEPYTEMINLLYIYPLSLKYDSQKMFKARNITCTVKFIRGGDDKNNKDIIDRLGTKGPFVASASCAVQHHNQSPTFGDEFKLKLPLDLTIADHLLFIFTHVSISGQSGVKTPEAPENPVGYAWLPLVRKNERLEMTMHDQDFALPVAAELPSILTRTRGGSVGKEDSEVKWVDSKPLFRVRLRLVSSIFTTTYSLQSFFQSCQKLENRGTIGDAADKVKVSSSWLRKRNSRNDVIQSPDEPPRSCSPLARYASFHADNPVVQGLIKHTESLIKEPIEELLPFLPILLSRLFSILPHAPSDVLALSIMKTIISICERCIAKGKKNLLRVFIKRNFVAECKNTEETVHTSICRYLPAVIRGSISTKSEKNEKIDNKELKSLLPHAWFFLEIVSKSLAQTIIHKKLNEKLPKDRVQAEVLDIFGSMVDSLINIIITCHRDLPEECRSANIAVSQFLKQCLSFIDRGVVFNWIHYVVRCFDESDFKSLREYKKTLLIILCEHEHWLPLNLPVLMDSNNQLLRITDQAAHANPTSTSATGFMTRFLHQFIQTTPSSSEIHESDRYAGCSDEWKLCSAYASRHFLVGLLFQELKAALPETREYRSQSIKILRNLLAKHSFDKRYSDLSKQQRIAILYAPLIRFAVDFIHELETVVQDANGGPELRILAKAFEKSSPTKTISPGLSAPLIEKLDSDEVRDILIAVLYIVHRLPRRILNAIWLESDGLRALQILSLFEIAANVFSYKGRENANMTTDRKSRKQSQQLLTPTSSKGTSIGELNQSNYTDSINDDTTIAFAVLQLLNLSQEVAMIIIEAIQGFSKFFADKYSKSLANGEHSEIFAKLLSIHLEFLKDSWAESVRLHAIAALAIFVNQFGSLLFEGGPLDALSVLIEHVLLQMASRLPSIQSAGAALLQLILRSGYVAIQTQLDNHAMAISVLPASSIPETRQLSPAERLGRSGAQTGVALARLLGTKSTAFPSHRFEKGLIALETLILAENKKGTVFDKAVMELIKQLRGVMLATVALKDAEKDAIRLAELHIQLADSYRGSAALRCAWFDALANVHATDKWYSEAAVCHTHSVAILAKELSEKGELNFDWTIFDWISKEIREQEQSIGKERTVQPAGITLENLTQKIETTAQMLISAERYEAIGPLYRIILPALEKRCDYNSLVSVYAELQQTCSRAGEIKLSGKRHLGSYFRVRFIGQAFEQDDDTEWIYREPGLTSLAEASLRMKENCISKNIHNVQFISETEINYTESRGKNAFLQITHVDPYLKEGQKSKDFSVHTNLRKFVYEAPLMEENAVNNDITGQALKRVMLEVQGQFPGSLRRMKVINRTEKLFTPLQFACQKLKMKADEIRGTLVDPLEGRTLDIKRLQLMLQGAVMATVNAGPLAYAEAFTKSEQIKRYGEEGTKMLCEAFRDLMSACEAALAANKASVGADQQTYHEVLSSSFQAMQERLLNFFGESFRAQTEEDKKNYPRSTIHVLDSIGGING